MTNTGETGASVIFCQMPEVLSKIRYIYEKNHRTSYEIHMSGKKRGSCGIEPRTEKAQSA